VDKFEKKLRRKVRLMAISLEKSTPEFKNSLSNGIVLSGYLEAIK